MTTETKLLTAEQAARIAELRDPELVLGALSQAGLIAEEPVNPLLVEAREVCQRVSDESGEAHYRRYLEGDWDNGHTMKVALAALRRGMELQREKLTREMVGQALEAATLAHFLRPNERDHPDAFSMRRDRLHAALTEVLQ